MHQHPGLRAPARRLVAIGIGVGLAVTLSVPTIAGATDRTTDDRTTDERPTDEVPTRPVDDRPTDQRPTDTEPTDVRPVDVRPTDTKPTDVRPTDVKPTDVRPTDRPEHESLRLHCAGRTSDTGRAAIGCEWSPSHHPHAAGYLLIRTDGDTRTVVLRTSNLRRTSAIDTEIRVGTVYRYTVLVVDEHGRTIGSGGPVRVGVKAPDRDIEVLDLACELRSADRLAVTCRWSEASNEAAVGYQLWRLVDRGHRELVWRGGLDHQSHVDPIPATAHRVVYAILAVDADGHIVGRSRPAFVRIPSDGPDIRPTFARIGRAYN